MKAFTVKYTKDMGWIITGKSVVLKHEEGMTVPLSYMLGEYDIIYDKHFARALWGETELMEMLTQPKYMWQHHLQNMVIADDPIKYLGDNI